MDCHIIRLTNYRGSAVTSFKFINRLYFYRQDSIKFIIFEIYKQNKKNIFSIYIPWPI